MKKKHNYLPIAAKLFLFTNRELQILLTFLKLRFTYLTVQVILEFRLNVLKRKVALFAMKNTLSK